MYYLEPQAEAEPQLDRVEAALIFILILAWILPGLVGHEPWKPDEAYNFGLIHHLMESGNWLTLGLPDESPFVRPPLFYWTAALFGQILSPFIGLPDAVRLATGFYMGIALLFVVLAGRILHGNGRYAALMLVGSFGLLGHAHQLIADSALFAGCAIALYGFALRSRNAFFAGLVAGTGIGIGFLSRGTIAPAFFAPVLLLLPIFGARIREQIVFIIALAASLSPWILIWPWQLASAHPELLSAWLKRSLDISFGLGRAPHPSWLFYVSLLPWFAWPTLPVAILVAWRERAKLLEERFLLPLAVFLSMLIVLSSSHTTRELYAMPMLLPLALLAASSMESMKRNLASAFNWFGIITFGLLTLLFWTGWIAMVTGHPLYIAARIHHYHPDFVGHFQPLSFFFAFAATLLWIWLITHTEHNGRRATLNWASGIVTVWMILMTLWLPFLDSIKGYREMFLSMKATLPGKYTCIEEKHLGEAQRAMLDYYLDVVTRKKHCDLVLVQTVSSNRRHPQGLKLIWEGARAGDRFERYRLYRITTSKDNG
ncbi:MAG: glycosyltransferase family 39 protein [Burkholderiales bacterium]|nr:glycosyltransferase family 39 protein [Burkholderiales bacterium]